MALEVQAARRDDAEERLQRRERHRRLARLRESRTLPALDVRFVLRWLAVPVGHHRLAETGRVRGQIEDVAVAAIGRDGIGLGAYRLRDREAGDRRRERAADEVAAPVAGLGADGVNVVLGQEVLGRRTNASRRAGAVLHGFVSSIGIPRRSAPAAASRRMTSRQGGGECIGI